MFYGMVINHSQTQIFNNLFFRTGSQVYSQFTSVFRGPFLYLVVYVICDREGSSPYPLFYLLLFLFMTKYLNQCYK